MNFWRPRLKRIFLFSTNMHTLDYLSRLIQSVEHQDSIDNFLIHTSFNFHMTET